MRSRYTLSRMAPLLVLTTVFAVSPGVASAQDDVAVLAVSPPDEDSQPLEEARPAGLAYEVTFTGLDGTDLADLLSQTSSLVGLKDDPPPSLLSLERRAADDRERLLTALRSAGYYDSAVVMEIDQKRTPLVVTVAVTPGPAYQYQTISITSTTGTPLPGGPYSGSDFGLVEGATALAPPVADAQGAILRRLIDAGHPFATMAERRAVVDHNIRKMDVTFVIEPGPLVRLGATRIDGLEDINENLIRGRLPFKEGDVYNPAMMDQAREQIAQLGAFDSVRVRLADEPGPDGVTPVVVTVDERLARYIGASVNYSTADGAGVKTYWGHRNLFGGAEQLRLGLEVDRLAGGSSGKVKGGTTDLPDLRFSANFRKPDFLAYRQTLVLNFEVVADEPPAYQRVATIASVELERMFTDHLTVSYGVRAERGRVRTNARTYQTALVGVPLGIAWDGSNNLMNPTSGMRLSAKVTPWFPAGGDTTVPFTSVQLNGSAYYDVVGDQRYVLAGRVGLGATFGGTMSTVPPDRRFFAGGGGSVRGYGFQKAGPRDVFGDPTGGRALFEVGAEMRIKVTDTIGVVPFVDAASVYDRSFPDFSVPFKVGAGLGMRYYTGFGPLRVDVGVPLNPEKDDDRWQLYLSLGQAF